MLTISKYNKYKFLKNKYNNNNKKNGKIDRR